MKVRDEHGNHAVICVKEQVFAALALDILKDRGIFGSDGTETLALKKYVFLILYAHSIAAVARPKLHSTVTIIIRGFTPV